MPRSGSAERVYFRFHHEESCSAGNCDLVPLPDLPVAICPKHAIEVAEYISDLRHLSVNRAEVERESTPDIWAMSGVVAPRRKRSAGPDGVVYYVRFADHIKIGTTEHLAKRMKAMHVHPSALAAVERGGREVERQRHAMFADERVSRSELFTVSDRLTDHIRHVRSMFGDPAGYLVA